MHATGSPDPACLLYATQGPAEMSAPCNGLEESKLQQQGTTQYPAAPDRTARGFSFVARLPSDSLWMTRDIRWGVANVTSTSGNVTHNSNALQTLVHATNSMERVW